MGPLSWNGKAIVYKEGEKGIIFFDFIANVAIFPILSPLRIVEKPTGKESDF